MRPANRIYYGSIAQRFSMHESRLGDELDDFCIKCKRLTNHQIVSLLNGQAAKVRCRTCYHDHDFRNGEPLPSKKDLKKAQLFEQVLAGAGAPPAAPVVVPIDGDMAGAAAEDAVADTASLALQEAHVDEVPLEAVPVKKGRKTAKR